MAGNSGECSRDLVVAVRDGPGQGVCFTGVCGGIGENDRCGSADIAGVDEGETVAPHRSYKPSFAPNRICGAQQILHIEVRLKEGEKVFPPLPNHAPIGSGVRTHFWT